MMLIKIILHAIVKPLTIVIIELENCAEIKQ